MLMPSLHLILIPIPISSHPIPTGLGERKGVNSAIAVRRGRRWKMDVEEWTSNSSTVMADRALTTVPGADRSQRGSRVYVSLINPDFSLLLIRTVINIPPLEWEMDRLDSAAQTWMW